MKDLNKPRQTKYTHVTYHISAGRKVYVCEEQSVYRLYQVSRLDAHLFSRERVIEYMTTLYAKDTIIAISPVPAFATGPVHHS